MEGIPRKTFWGEARVERTEGLDQIAWCTGEQGWSLRNILDVRPVCGDACVTTVMEGHFGAFQVVGVP